MLDVTVVQEDAELNQWMSGRTKQLIQLPADFASSTPFRIGHRHTVSKPVTVEGLGSKWGRPVKLHIRPTERNSSCFIVNGQEIVAASRHAGAAWNSLCVGPISVAEHLLSMQSALGFVAEYELQGGKSVPTWHGCLGPVLDAITPHIVRGDLLRTYRVATPFGVMFENGAYALFQPEARGGRLIIDHQFHHQFNALGEQRIIHCVTPGSFVKFARAQPPLYGRRGSIVKFFHRRKFERVPLTGLRPLDFVFVEKDRLENANPEFMIDGRSAEVILHELIDKLGALALLEKRFVGTVVTNRTSHKQDVVWARLLANHLTERP